MITKKELKILVYIHKNNTVCSLVQYLTISCISIIFLRIHLELTQPWSVTKRRKFTSNEDCDNPFSFKASSISTTQKYSIGVRENEASPSGVVSRLINTCLDVTEQQPVQRDVFQVIKHFPLIHPRPISLKTTFLPETPWHY